MITRVECFQECPKDRDYNKRGKPREPQIEIFGGGVCYALRTQYVYGLAIWDDDDDIRLPNTDS